MATETVPNQRTIKTNKAPHSGTKAEEYYTPINLTALQKAMTRLGGNAFKMWCYLGKNQNNYTFALSRVDTLAWCGFSKNTYTAAFNELVEKGFLVQAKDGSNHYDFYEVSTKPEKTPTITVHKEEPKEFSF